MGKLVVTEFMTLDGVAQAPGGPDEDRDGGFAHGGWQAPVADHDSGGVIFEQARSMDALLLGRRTYVASRTLTGSLAWQGSTLVGDALAESITALKGRHNEVHVIGSLDLLQSLLRFGLVDRMNLWVYPLLLGSGKQVFAGGTVPTALRLTTSVTHPSGTLQLAYETAGVPTYGSLAE